MLGKLLKYDLKWTYKLVGIFYCLALVFSLITFGFNRVENSMLFYILGRIATGFAISMAVSALINCVMRSWARFVRNIYKDESYLTHTLPVTKSTIFSSKVLSAIICTFTTIAVAAACLVICFYGQEQVIESLKASLELTASTLDSTVINILLIVLFVLVLEVIFILFVGYTGIIIGHKSNKRKMAKSIIIAFAVYMISNAVSVGIVYVAGLANSDIMNIFSTTGQISVESIKAVMLIEIIIYAVLNIICFLISRHLLDKGVNVD